MNNKQKFECGFALVSVTMHALPRGDVGDKCGIQYVHDRIEFAPLFLTVHFGRYSQLAWPQLLGEWRAAPLYFPLVYLLKPKPIATSPSQT